MTEEEYPIWFLIRFGHNGQSAHGDDRKNFWVMTLIWTIHSPVLATLEKAVFLIL